MMESHRREETDWRESNTKNETESKSIVFIYEQSKEQEIWDQAF